MLLIVGLKYRVQISTVLLLYGGGSSSSINSSKLYGISPSFPLTLPYQKPSSSSLMISTMSPTASDNSSSFSAM